MSERLEPVHIVDPPIGEAEEVAYDPSRMGPGSFVIEVEFSSEEIDRLREAVTRGRYARFIKRAALELPTARPGARPKSSSASPPEPRRPFASTHPTSTRA